LDDPQMKKYLVELEASGYEQFFGDEDDDLVIPPSERWKEPAFKEKREKLIAEMLAAFAQKESDREHRNDLNALRSTELTEEQKTQQLLELQKKLRGKS
jgi:hypothetical protein